MLTRLDYIHKYHFGGLRGSVLTRDQFKCRKCGMTQERHREVFNRDISVDHIDGDRKNNTLENLQTLCLKCHGKKDNKRSSRTIQSLIDRDLPDKYCPLCKQRRPKEEFRKNNRTVDKRYGFCNPCERTYQNEWKAKKLKLKLERELQNGKE
jgi:rubrerythrin